jgi:hypothetical protein
MKAIIFLTAGMLSLNAIAGTMGSDDHMGDKYCAKMKDGKMVVMKGDTEVMNDVTLANGTKIKKDGTVIKKDGSMMVLKEGECVDKDGKMPEMKSKTKEKKGEKKTESKEKSY